MKHTVRQYAEAFLGALHEKKEKERAQVIKGLLETLRRNGDKSKLTLILNETEKQYYKNQNVHKIKLSSVFPVHDSTKKEILKSMGNGVVADEVIDASLLGGIKILVDDEILIDATAKRQLERLFM